MGNKIKKFKNKMKLSLVILSSFSATHGFNTAREAVGTTEVCEDGIYAHPTLCNAYYQCANGHQFPDQFCPDDLLFNGEVCDQPENVTCPTVEYDATAYSCEHADQNPGQQNAQLECEDGLVIRINSATYGKPTQDQCIRSNQQNKNCGSSADHTAYAQSKCDGEQACTYHGTNNVAGDPCHGVAKHTVIEYSCVQN